MAAPLIGPGGPIGTLVVHGEFGQPLKVTVTSTLRPPITVSEPVTPAGQVYASEAFAALAAAEQTQNFTSDYVGQMPMAKGYGTLPAYHVRLRRAKPR